MRPEEYLITDSTVNDSGSDEDENESGSQSEEKQYEEVEQSIDIR